MAIDAAAPPPRDRGVSVRLAIAILLVLVAVVVGLVVDAASRAGLYAVAPLARSAPKRTAMMRQREAEARSHGRTLGIDQRWVPYARVSPWLRRALLTAEDDAFFQHGGLDWNEIKASAKVNLEKHRFARGGSTITQQLARNLFLGDARTPTRKLTEAFLAVRLEDALTKQRIFELYLNLIEWGDGIFGAEAAARRYFGVAAADLNARQSILLAAVVINPRRYSVLDPGRRIERRVRLIAGRMRRRGVLSEAEYAEAIGAEPPVIEAAGPPAETTAVEAPLDTAAPADTAAESAAADTAAVP